MDNDIMLEKVRLAEEAVKAYLPEACGYGGKVMEAMNYSVMAGGKRLRPVLMRESYLACGGAPELEKQLLYPFMAALEFIHNYSLVHDDLPAMDNDEYRRGRKTTHAVYGAGMATLAGDGLLNLAFEVAADACNGLAREEADKEGLLIREEADKEGLLIREEADKEELLIRAVRATGILADKAGIRGMVGGQSADLEAENPEISAGADMLKYIHEHKTSALIEAALMCGAVLAGADRQAVEDMEEAGRLTGLAFQIRDDILDMEGDEAKLGKPLHSDEKNGKCTYISVHGMEKAKADCDLFSEKAADIVSRYAGKNGFLTELIMSLTRRES